MHYPDFLISRTGERNIMRVKERVFGSSISFYYEVDENNQIISEKMPFFLDSETKRGWTLTGYIFGKKISVFLRRSQWEEIFIDTTDNEVSQ